MGFIIELSVVTAGLVLAVVGLSVAILYPSKGYRSKKAAIITPVVFAVLVGAAGPEDHGNIREWLYFALPTLLLAPLFVASICHRKRLKERN